MGNSLLIRRVKQDFVDQSLSVDDEMLRCRLPVNMKQMAGSGGDSEDGGLVG